MERLPFRVESDASLSRARTGQLTMRHGVVETPIFMPVGTNSTVKGLRTEELWDVGSRILLANTYHLLLRPGAEVFERIGGIHRFMNWPGAVLTDSGGFQVFSLPDHVRLDESGATFKSHLDGRQVVLTPESCIAMQRAIGSDIMMVLDQCVPSTSSYAVAQSAMELTHRWAPRCLAARGDSRQALFGIVQGACYEDLRKESARCLTAMPFDGFAIGGLAVGETRSEREEMAALVTEYLPKDRPRYLMGVGTPIDLLEAVHRGVDMFDCILPTALSQQGVAYTARGRLRLSRSVYKFENDPIDANCPCYTCQRHSKAYLHHLTKTREHLGWHLLSLHNLTFYHQLMSRMREAIRNDSFAAFYAQQREILVQGDDEFPAQPPKASRARTVPESLGDYDVIISPQGFASIRQKSSGEVMHSSSAPNEEARSLYVEQVELCERLAAPGEQKPLVIWDVGLGAGHNAMAAILSLEETYQRLPPENLRPVHMISFERDLDSLRLALSHRKHFPHLKHGAPNVLVANGSWHSKHFPLLWELVHGDFLTAMDTSPRPDIVYFDPFSAKTDSAFWTYKTFTNLLRHFGDEPVEMYTYSASTAVRSALLAAGFYVAKGRGTGPKAETTIALTPRTVQEQAKWRDRLLNQEWLDRWRRSSARVTTEVPVSEHEWFEARILQHPQFDQP